jgi:hypothetical protein
MKIYVPKSIQARTKITKAAAAKNQLRHISNKLTHPIGNVTIGTTIRIDRQS